MTTQQDEADDKKFQAEHGIAPRDACHSMSVRLTSYIEDVLRVDPSVLSTARELLPCRHDGDSSAHGYLELLCAHFKANLFEWILRPDCATCGRQCNGTLSYGAPTAAETALGRVRRVEVWECGNGECSGQGRFPRFRDADALLLRSRRGRCGEWAKGFWLLCRAAGEDVRIVYDFTDHVWVEVRDADDAGRYVHVDVCEGLVDEPLLYEACWGKALTWVFAIDARGHVQDVTRDYTQAFGDVLARRADKGVPEAWLAQELARLNDRA